MSFTKEDVDVYLQTTIAAICEELDIEYINASSLELLTQLLSDKLTSISRHASSATQQSGRTITNTSDVAMGIYADKLLTENVKHYDFTSLVKYTESHAARVKTHGHPGDITVNSAEHNIKATLRASSQTHKKQLRRYNHHANVEYDYTLLHQQTLPPTTQQPHHTAAQLQTANLTATATNNNTALAAYPEAMRVSHAVPPFLPPQSAFLLHPGTNLSTNPRENNTIIAQQYTTTAEHANTGVKKQRLL